VPPLSRRPLVRRRDLRKGRRTVDLPLPGGRPARPGHRRPPVATTRPGRRPALLRPGAARRHGPFEVTTDRPRFTRGCSTSWCHRPCTRPSSTHNATVPPAPMPTRRPHGVSRILMAAMLKSMAAPGAKRRAGITTVTCERSETRVVETVLWLAIMFGSVRFGSGTRSRWTLPQWAVTVTTVDLAARWLGRLNG
jgi:hypothetical protein